MSEMKFCKDCKWFRPRRSWVGLDYSELPKGRCARKTFKSTCLITGVESEYMSYASNERKYNEENRCGERAIYFEPKRRWWKPWARK